MKSKLFRWLAIVLIVEIGLLHIYNAQAEYEEAVYMGMVIHPVRKIRISAYADFYRFPWLIYGVSAPSAGSDYLLQADYSVNKRTDMYLRLKYEIDPGEESIDTVALPDVIHMHRTGIRYHISYTIARGIIFQNRFEMVKVREETGKTGWGFLVYQDVGYRFKTLPLGLDFRLALFKTTDYRSRVYAYEQDLTAGFSFSPLYDTGYRTYVMLRYEPDPRISFRFRFARTGFAGTDTIGSGYDEITGSSRNDVKLQFILQI